MQLTKRKNIRLPHHAYGPQNVFFITISTFEKYPWFQIYPQFAETAIGEIKRLSEKRSSQLLAWCLMPDHIHLLLRDENIVAFVKTFKGRLTVNSRCIEPDRRLWQRSFYDHGLRKEEALLDIARYIIENPIRAGISNKVDDYPWSGSIWS